MGTAAIGVRVAGFDAPERGQPFSNVGTLMLRARRPGTRPRRLTRHVEPARSDVCGGLPAGDSVKPNTAAMSHTYRRVLISALGRFILVDYLAIY
jgi:hypothetical protein